VEGELSNDSVVGEESMTDDEEASAIAFALSVDIVAVIDTLSVVAKTSLSGFIGGCDCCGWRSEMMGSGVVAVGVARC